MSEIINIQAKLISSAIIFFASWIFGQSSVIEPIISQGFDQLISLAFLATGIMIIWKALDARTKENIEFKKKMIEELKEELRQERERNL